MSMVYNNWERLVAAVQKREEIRKLCRSDSIESSTISLSSDFTPTSNSTFHANLDFTRPEDKQTATQIEHEWTKQYEPGVYVDLATCANGTTDIKRVHFSRRRFSKKERYTWWLNNRETVFKKYNDEVKLARLRQLTVSSLAGIMMNGEEVKVAKASTELQSLGRAQRMLLRTTLEENTRPESSKGEIVAEWKEQYVAGVYITVAAFKDGSREIKRLRFSWRKFNQREAKAWWLENRERVFETYSRSTGPSLMTLSSLSNLSPLRHREQSSCRSDGNRNNNNPNELLVEQRRNKGKSLETNFDQVLPPANLEGPLAFRGQEPNEWIEYEPGIYITLVHNEHGSNAVERVRFCQKRFGPREAEAWWINNQENVYRCYNVTARLSRIKQRQESRLGCKYLWRKYCLTGSL